MRGAWCTWVGRRRRRRTEVWLKPNNRVPAPEEQGRAGTLSKHEPSCQVTFSSYRLERGCWLSGGSHRGPGRVATHGDQRGTPGRPGVLRSGPRQQCGRRSARSVRGVVHDQGAAGEDAGPQGPLAKVWSGCREGEGKGGAVPQTDRGLPARSRAEAAPVRAPPS